MKLTTQVYSTIYSIVLAKVVTFIKLQHTLSETLEIEPTILDSIALSHCNPEAACRDMFSWWLSGEGVECTWEELIKMLEIPRAIPTVVYSTDHS